MINVEEHWGPLASTADAEKVVAEPPAPAPPASLLSATPQATWSLAKDQRADVGSSAGDGVAHLGSARVISDKSTAADAGQPSAFDVVLSYYSYVKIGSFVTTKELLLQFANTSTLRNANATWYFYDKRGNSSFDFALDFPHKRIVAVPLPNVGREGHTYMSHVVRNYDALANHTLFCQENPAWNQIYHRLDVIFDAARTGFLSLGIEVKCCQCRLLPRRLHCHYFAQHELCAFYQFSKGQPSCSNDFKYVATACFVVSRQRIRRHPRAFYERWSELLAAPPDHPLFTTNYSLAPGIELGPYPARPDGFTANNPILGHILERLWASAIFDCQTVDYSKCWMLAPRRDDTHWCHRPLHCED